MMLKAERDIGNVKVLAITTLVGNTTLENVIKNTYRILDGLNRTDVRKLNIDEFFFSKTIFWSVEFDFRFRFTKVQSRP